MGRKKKSILRPIASDVRFESQLASKFVNNMMWDGKKDVARRIFYHAMETLQEKLPKEDPLRVFEQAIENVKPISR